MTLTPGTPIEWWDENTQEWRAGVLRSVTARYRVTGPTDPLVGSEGWSVFTDGIRSAALSKPAYWLEGSAPGSTPRRPEQGQAER